MEKQTDRIEEFVAYAKDVLSRGEWWAIQQIYDEMEEFDIAEDETQFAWSLILPYVYRWMIAALGKFKKLSNAVPNLGDPNVVLSNTVEIVEFLGYVQYLKKTEGFDFLQRYLDKAMQNIGLSKLDLAKIIMNHVYMNWTPDAAQRVNRKSSDSMSVTEALLHLGIPASQVRWFVDNLSNMEFIKARLTSYDKSSVIKYILTNMKNGRTRVALEMTDRFISAGFDWPELEKIRDVLQRSKISGDE